MTKSQSDWITHLVKKKSATAAEQAQLVERQRCIRIANEFASTVIGRTIARKIAQGVRPK